jgi:hypothetical protein
MIRSHRSSLFLLGFFSGLILPLATPTPVHALATEHLGNEAIGHGWGFGKELLTAVNLPERVYWYEVNGNPYFYFRGSSSALNDAIRKFIAIPADKREIILLPGPGETKTLTRDKRIDYDWSLHVPGGLALRMDEEIGDNRATLTIHIRLPNPQPVANPAQVRQWIADLDEKEFKVREQATKELEKLGNSAAPILRESLKGNISSESRTRIERLLKLMPEIGLDQLELPKEVTVVGIEELLDRYRKATQDKNPTTRGYALTSLAHRGAEPEEVLAEVLKVLKEEKHEYPLRCAASVLAHLKVNPKSVTEAMKEHLQSKDESVRHAFEQALKIIEADKKVVEEEKEKKLRSTIRKDIQELVKKRTTK